MKKFKNLKGHAMFYYMIFLHEVKKVSARFSSLHEAKKMYLVGYMLVVNVLLMFCCHFSMKGNNVKSMM